MAKEITIKELIEILQHHLSMLKEESTLFDVGTTIGISTSLSLQDVNGWRKEDLEWGIKYGLGWKDGTSDQVIKDYELHKKASSLSRSVHDLIGLEKDLKNLEDEEKRIRAIESIEDNSHDDIPFL